MNWRYIESLEDIEQALKRSDTTPILIFKHSTRCAVSLMAKRKLESEWTYEESQVLPYFLDLIKYRELSNKIAEISRVRHQSPQAILLKAGKAMYNGSHYEIDISFLGD